MDQEIKDLLTRIASSLERIAELLQATVTSTPEQGEASQFEGEEDLKLSYPARRTSKIPDALKSSTVEELGEKLVVFVRKELPDEERGWMGLRYIEAAGIFWDELGVNKYALPPDAALKVHKVEIFARKMVQKDLEKREQERIEQERAILPQLQDALVVWARSIGLRKVAMGDIDAFLVESSKSLTPHSKRALQSLANLTLKIS